MLIDVFDPDPKFPRTSSLNWGSNTLAAVVDGSGSWGSGADAASWALCRLRAEWASAGHPPGISVANDVARIVETMPIEFRNADFGWAFSVTVVACSEALVTWYAAGLYAVDHFRAQVRLALFRPRMLADDLIEKGASEAHVAAVRHAALGPFVGDAQRTQMTSGTCALHSGDILTVTDARHSATLSALSVNAHQSAKDLEVALAGSRILEPAILVRA